MAGSALAPIVIPIAALLSLAFWIFMIFYADSHPAHGGGPTPPLDSGEYDTGLQGPYLTKPELRLPAQERWLDAAHAATAGPQQPDPVPGQRQPEPRAARQPQR